MDERPCTIDKLCYTGTVLYCNECGWAKRQGTNQSLSDLVIRIGRLHVNDFPSDELGQFRVVERLMQEGRASDPVDVAGQGASAP